MCSIMLDLSRPLLDLTDCPTKLALTFRLSFGLAMPGISEDACRGIAAGFAHFIWSLTRRSGQLQAFQNMRFVKPRRSAPRGRNRLRTYLGADREEEMRHLLHAAGRGPAVG
ncbi:unnamed protein product [Prorocentrum cordatum]|uniref:Uncharacterized protein n=1 Tax=Prorocentrum cordatum TaxID=2364126 RepID=A0ABN9VSH1_9DINO|nr:unnamed protein product [Polarella glacialis]